MAKKAPVTSRGTVSKRSKVLMPLEIYWTKQNTFLLILGLVLLIIGFGVMSIGPWDSSSALVVAPIILAITYVVVFPIAILYTKKKKAQETIVEEE